MVVIWECFGERADHGQRHRASNRKWPPANSSGADVIIGQANCRGSPHSVSARSLAITRNRTTKEAIAPVPSWVRVTCNSATPAGTGRLFRNAEYE